MKTKICLTIIFYCALFANNIHAQEQAIKGVIEKETKAFANKDVEAWQSCWDHTPAAFFSYTQMSGSLILSGWDEIASEFKDSFKERDVYPTNVERWDFEFDISGSFAFVSFKQKDQMLENERETQETRVLKKSGDQWKIVSTQVVNLSSYSHKGERLHHVIMASFKPNTDPNDIKFIASKFAGIVNQVEGMRSCSMFKNEDPNGDFEYTWVMIFDSAEALAAYESHKDHSSAVEKWEGLGDKVLVIDSWK